MLEAAGAMADTATWQSTRQRGVSAAVLLALSMVWCAGSTQREKRVVGDKHEAKVLALESEAARLPGDPAKIRELAQGYLDARQPGMAVSTIERASPEVRKAPLVTHLYARALLEEGRSADALEAEREVLARCEARAAEPCAPWLVGSATRRVDILTRLVALGVEDVPANPAAAGVAYLAAGRSVTVGAP